MLDGPELQGAAIIPAGHGVAEEADAGDAGNHLPARFRIKALDKPWNVGEDRQPLVMPQARGRFAPLPPQLADIVRCRQRPLPFDLGKITSIFLRNYQNTSINSI